MVVPLIKIWTSGRRADCTREEDDGFIFLKIAS